MRGRNNQILTLFKIHSLEYHNGDLLYIAVIKKFNLIFQKLKNVRYLRYTSNIRLRIEIYTLYEKDLINKDDREDLKCKFKNRMTTNYLVKKL